MVDWKVIEGYELYEISSDGRVRRDGKELKPFVINSGKGYYQVKLSKNNRQYAFLISRLVAQAFIAFVKNKAEVDHINRNTLDNRIENLRWANRSDQNINKDIKIGKSGHKYIYYIQGYYKVRITREGKLYTKGTSTLEEAIKHRDEMLIQLRVAENPVDVPVY